jgi:hypothetical protein
MLQAAAETARSARQAAGGSAAAYDDEDEDEESSSDDDDDDELLENDDTDKVHCSRAHKGDAPAVIMGQLVSQAARHWLQQYQKQQTEPRRLRNSCWLYHSQTLVTWYQPQRGSWDELAPARRQQTHLHLLNLCSCVPLLLLLML